MQCTDLWQSREGGFAGEDEAGFLWEEPSTEKLGRTQRVCQHPNFPGGALRAEREPVNQLAGMAGLGAAVWNPWKLEALDPRVREFRIRPLAKGIRNSVARTVVSKLWKFRHGQGLHAVLCWKCRQRPTETPWSCLDDLLCGQMLVLLYLLPQWLPGVYFLCRWRLTKAACTQNVILREVWRPGASSVGRGLKAGKPFFLTCLCYAGGCSIYRLGVWGGRRGRRWPISFIPSQGGCKGAWGKSCFISDKTWSRATKVIHCFVGSFWKAEIQNVLIHLL